MKLFTLLACVVSTLSAPSRIFNGNEASAHQFPWVAAIYIDNKYFCEGALIGESWVITAAHCAIEGSSFRVLLGSTKSGGVDPERVQVVSQEPIIHESYNPNGLQHDIALLKLSRAINPSSNVHPILLSQKKAEEGLEVTITGWGQSGDDADLPINENLLFATMTTMSNENCALVYGNTIHPEMMCTSHSGAILQSACEGDSGSPLADLRAKNLVGVFSFYSGHGCQSGDPSGFTRVASYRDWIRDKTGI